MVGQGLAGRGPRAPQAALLALALLTASVVPQRAEAEAGVQPSVQTLNVDRGRDFTATWSAGSEPFRLDRAVPEFCLRLAGERSGCAAGSLLGRLPAEDDGAPDGIVSSFSETLSVPEAIVRRALEMTAGGRLSTIYYVRRMDPVPGGDIGQGLDRPAFPAVRLNLGVPWLAARLSSSRPRCLAVSPARAGCAGSPLPSRTAIAARSASKSIIAAPDV